MDTVADLELGFAQELVVGLGGEQVGDLPEFRVGGLARGLIDPLGFVGLFGAEGQ